MNGGCPQSAEHMLKVGTYNAIIGPNEYYSPEHFDFASSHKTFKRMMPTFAWEVIEVYSGPPTVAFKWRHWGTMKNDYVGFNKYVTTDCHGTGCANTDMLTFHSKGEKVTAKAHGGPIEIFGITVANVDDKVRLQAVDTWMDPLVMFRQIAPYGVVNKEPMHHKAEKTEALGDGLDHNGVKIAEKHNQQNGDHAKYHGAEEDIPKHISNRSGRAADACVPQFGGCPFLADQTTTTRNGDHETHQEQQASEIMPTASADGSVHVNGTMEAGTLPAVAATPIFHMDIDHVQSIIETAAVQGAEMDVDKPRPNPSKTTIAEVAVPTVVANGETQLEPEILVNHQTPAKRPADEDIPRSIYSSAITGDVEQAIKIPRSHNYVDESVTTGTYNAVDRHLECSAEHVHPHPKDVEDMVEPDVGEAVAAAAGSEETLQTQAEMSDIKLEECESMMNRE